MPSSQIYLYFLPAAYKWGNYAHEKKCYFRCMGNVASVFFFVIFLFNNFFNINNLCKCICGQNRRNYYLGTMLALKPSRTFHPITWEKSFKLYQELPLVISWQSSSGESTENWAFPRKHEMKLVIAGFFVFLFFSVTQKKENSDPVFSPSLHLLQGASSSKGDICPGSSEPRFSPLDHNFMPKAENQLTNETQGLFCSKFSYC